MVPLESVLRKPSQHSEPIYVPPPERPKAPAELEPAPRGPRTFRVIDVRSRAVLAEDATARATLDVLRDVRSIVDVNVYVWESTAAKWRLLTFDEQRLLWDHRGAPASAPDAGGGPVRESPDRLASAGSAGRDR
jgi:hypothetical protein